MNNSVINICIQVSVRTYVLSLGQVIRGVIAIYINIYIKINIILNYKMLEIISEVAVLF